MRVGDSSFLFAKSWVEESVARGEYTNPDRYDSPDIREETARGFALGFTGASVASVVGAPFIVATKRIRRSDLVDFNLLGGGLTDSQKRARTKLTVLATLGAPGLAIGLIVGVIGAAGGAIVGTIKRAAYLVERSH